MDRNKTCFKCGEVKSLDDFYRHSKMADGHLGKCKECAKKDVKERYERDFEKISAYERDRFQTEHRKAKTIEYQRTRRAKNPEKNRARAMVGYAIKAGHLARGPCESCGTTIKVQAHHDDYLKPLQVRWFCFKCHREHAHGQTTLETRIIL